MINRAFLIIVMFSIAALQAAHAEQKPIAGASDPRMRTINYDPEQVVHLSTAVGATMVVTFAATETVTSVAVSNSADLAAMPRENFLFLKSKVALPAQPVVVLTSGPSGLRRYVFSVVTTNMDNLEVSQSNLYYSVQFRYPADEAAARRKAEQDRLAERQIVAAQRANERALAELDDPGLQTSSINNWRYMGQGDRSLAPVSIHDNGQTTFFRFPGRSRIPAIFSIGSDGEEISVNFAVKGDTVEIASVERGWRLRDGKTVLCIWNTNFDPVGVSSASGTVSPNVQRIVKEQAP